MKYEDYPYYVEDDVIAENSLKESREEEWSEFIKWRESHNQNPKED